MPFNCLESLGSPTCNHFTYLHVIRSELKIFAPNMLFENKKVGNQNLTAPWQTRVPAITHSKMDQQIPSTVDDIERLHSMCKYHGA